ncbi:importin beta-3 subunit [Aspergillus luchuensis]|uniref:Importin beta-3 subunit n=1 Tax=Aspergillus kawachii TaxID=1069201 RepID=A0A146FU26_ASPKA|nr:importin beta-3 subunit [Aspergillus luchuensis]
MLDGGVNPKFKRAHHSKFCLGTHIVQTRVKTAMRLARAESGGRAGKWRLVLPFWEGLPAAYSWSPYCWTISAWKDLPGVE